MYPKGCDNKPVVGRKELGTPVNSAVQKNPPTSTHKDVIYLFRHTANIAVPRPAARLSSLKPGAPNSQPSEHCEVQKEGTVDIPCTRSMRTDTYLVASSLNPSHCVEVAQDNECVAERALID